MLGHKRIKNSIKLAHNRLNHTQIKDNICNSVDYIFKSLLQFTKYTNTIATNLIHTSNQAHNANNSTLAPLAPLVNTNTISLPTNTYISDIFTIKNTTLNNTSVTVKIYKLDNTTTTTTTTNTNANYIIPPYLDIFTQLFNNTEWLKLTSLTQQDIQELKTLLFSNQTNKDKYIYLDSHKVGNTLGDAFYSSLIKNSLPITIVKQYPSLNLHKLLINDFASWSVISNIESTMTHIAIVSFTFEGLIFNDSIYIFINEHTISSRLEHITKLATDIVHRIVFYNKLLNTTSTPRRFILYLTDLEKEFDDDIIAHRHFKAQHVNSAVTNKQDIIIYRKQELLKSIFHELNHFHTMDFITIPSNVVNHLISTHNIASTNTYLLYECVTEALANVLNNIYLSRTILEFKSNFSKELRFSTVQVAKILKICGYANWNAFAGKNMHIDIRKHFKQDSCVFSYYILKLYILLSFPTYIVNCLDANTLKFNVNIGFNKLIEIFDSVRTNQLFSKTIDKIIKILNKKKVIVKKRTGKTTNTFKFLKTMRMTCL